jgi:hypothetical protein
MNKQKRAIILLQANALRNTLKHVEEIPTDIRTWAFEEYGRHQTSPKKASGIVAKMKPAKLALILRAICLENPVIGFHRQDSYWGSRFSTKTVLMAVTNKSWFLAQADKLETHARIPVARIHGYQTHYLDYK